MSEDDVGIDLLKTKLYLNGLEQQYSADSKAKFATTISANLALGIGANSIKLKLFNASGNETIKIWRINRSAK